MKTKQNILQTVQIAFLALAALTLMACQSTSGGTSGPAVMCGKCKTVWVKSPTTVGAPGKGYTVYRDQKTMACPDCESAAATFFKTGSLKHHCAHCGDTLAHCEAH
jgi:hypothetical protein